MGQFDALNADGSVNFEQNRALRGSEVTVYATGPGLTMPPIQAGQAAPSKPTPIAYYSVSAAVAGQPANLADASLVPDRPGVDTVRILIPQTTPVGPVEIKVSSASSSSQSRALIRVR